MKKTLALIPLFLCLLACIPQPIQSTATDSPATNTPVTPTLTPPPSPTQTPARTITVPSADQIIYYYFVDPKETTFPAESIVVMPQAYILAPTLSDAAPVPEAATNLRSALEAVLNDPRNGWLSENVEVVNVTFNNGHADVVLQGEYFGVGDVTLTAASQQILLTVFANANVQTATITLNGDTVGNLGASNSMNAKPADYAFTRAEIEAYMTEHMNATP